MLQDDVCALVPAEQRARLQRVAWPAMISWLALQGPDQVPGMTSSTAACMYLALATAPNVRTLLQHHDGVIGFIDGSSYQT